MYKYDQRPSTEFSNDSNMSIERIKYSEYSVLVGPNNCGKSFILKTLAHQIGQSASYIGPARYYNFNLLSNYMPSANKRAQRFSQFVNTWQNNQQNIDNSPLNLQQAIAELSNSDRDKLIKIIKILLGSDMQILHTVPDNSMSQQYISVSGHNISFTSSGFRLIATLITCLLDKDYDTFLIDEPELGISPEAQGIVADFIFDRTHRSKYFPHIKTIILATHSTIFLDRQTINNNYTVSKNGNEISIQQAQTISDLNRIHFFLLGNRFETLFLPSCIIIVEGKTDYSFIDRVLALHFPNHQFGLISANSDNRIKEILNIAKGLFADIQKSPYRERIFVVLDSIHKQGLIPSLIAMGIPQENIIVWSLNGIEHFYPPSIMNKVFGSGSAVSISGDTISRNGTSYTKADLSHKVCIALDRNIEMHQEFKERFMKIIAQAIQTEV